MESETVKVVVEIIKTVGFPAGVAIWFMFRTDKQLGRVWEMLRDLRDDVHDCPTNRAVRRHRGDD